MTKFGLVMWLLWPVTMVAQAISAGPGACSRCHVEALTQPTTYMAHALETVEESKVLTDHSVLTTNVGKYSYRIDRHGNQSEYTVTDGASTVALPIRWAPVRR